MLYLVVYSPQYYSTLRFEIGARQCLEFGLTILFSLLFFFLLTSIFIFLFISFMRLFL